MVSSIKVHKISQPIPDPTWKLERNNKGTVPYYTNRKGIDPGPVPFSESSDLGGLQNNFQLEARVAPGGAPIGAMRRRAR